MSIVEKTLLTLDGQLFSHKLEQLSIANDRMQRVRELFDLKREDTESCDLIDRGLVTKYTSFTKHHYHEDKKTSNPANRAMRRLRAACRVWQAGYSPPSGSGVPQPPLSRNSDVEAPSCVHAPALLQINRLTE